ncbi:hypothetical protein Tco_0853474 [Tanacetum coccineum]
MELSMLTTTSVDLLKVVGPLARWNLRLGILILRFTIRCVVDEGDGCTGGSVSLARRSPAVGGDNEVSGESGGVGKARSLSTSAVRKQAQLIGYNSGGVAEAMSSLPPPLPYPLHPSSISSSLPQSSFPYPHPHPQSSSPYPLPSSSHPSPYHSSSSSESSPDESPSSSHPIISQHGIWVNHTVVVGCHQPGIHAHGTIIVPAGSVIVPTGSVVTTGSVIVPTGSVVTTGSVIVPAGSVVTTGSVIVPTGSVVTTGSVIVPTGSVVTTGSVIVPAGSVIVPTGSVIVPTGSVVY